MTRSMLAPNNNDDNTCSRKQFFLILIFVICYERIKTEQDWSFNQFVVNASEFSV